MEFNNVLEGQEAEAMTKKEILVNLRAEIEDLLLKNKKDKMTFMKIKSII